MKLSVELVEIEKPIKEKIIKQTTGNKPTTIRNLAIDQIPRYLAQLNKQLGPSSNEIKQIKTRKQRNRLSVFLLPRENTDRLGQS